MPGLAIDGSTVAYADIGSRPAGRGVVQLGQHEGAVALPDRCAEGAPTLPPAAAGRRGRSMAARRIAGDRGGGQARSRRRRHAALHRLSERLRNLEQSAPRQTLGSGQACRHRRGEFDATMAAAIPLETCRRIQVPVLLFRGAKSPTRAQDPLATGLSARSVRRSIGLEDVDDILVDTDQAQAEATGRAARR